MDDKEKQAQTTINVWGLANIGCTIENPTFQTLVATPDERKTEEAEVVEEVELVDLKFFDAKKFGTIERQQKFRQVLLNVIPKMDVDSGRDWVAVYIAYHYYVKRLFIMKGYADFFSDIERLLPERLAKVKQKEPKGDKRYKSYTEALASECSYWFILDECLPEMAEWRSSKFNYRVDDNRRSRIQNLVKEIYQGLKDAEA